MSVGPSVDCPGMSGSVHAQYMPVKQHTITLANSDYARQYWTLLVKLFEYYWHRMRHFHPICW